MNTKDAATDSRVSEENERRILRREPNPWLFRPLRIKSVDIRNRIMLSPMCQYSAEDGVPNDWHAVHLGARAVGGAGIVCTEAVHTEPRARITRHCLGLWNNTQRDSFRRIVEFIEAQGAVPAIQLGHAGRKASVGRPWEGSKPVAAEAGGWPVVSASALPYAKGWPMPVELGPDEIRQCLDALAAAARRACEAGFRIIELHAAHGYLIHQFYSPLSNQRSDHYGGSFENRVRFLLESIAAVRSEWSTERPLFLRLSVTDWVDGGWQLGDSIGLVQRLKEAGDVDLIDC